MNPTPLLHRVAARDPRAVEECISRFGGLVWSMAKRTTRSASDAEDAVQEIFVDLWRSAARYSPDLASEAAFVAMIARRRLLDRKRSDRRRPTSEPFTEAIPMPSEAAAAETCVEAAYAARALASLRPEQQRVLVLALRHGLSHEEIAEATGMPLGTVKAHARRGLIRMRALLVGDASVHHEEGVR